MRRKRLFILALAAALLLSLSGCEQEREAPAQSVNFANTVMGGEAFAYRDGFVYFSDEGYMYEYDTVSGNAARLGAISFYRGRFLVATDEHISYLDPATNAVRYITRDGKQNGILCDRKGSKFFLDENTWYFIASKKYDEDQRSVNQLLSRDAETGEETLLYEADYINTYFVDEDYIYVVWIDITGYTDKGEVITESGLVRSPKEQIAFEPVETSVYPNAVFADGADLYISQRGDFQIWHCADGVATPLPVNSYLYQVFDGNLLYLQEIHEEGKPVNGLLRLYNMKTGEEMLLAEYVFYFAIFEQRYVTYAVTVDGQSYYRWYIYDLQTGETREMVKPV